MGDAWRGKLVCLRAFMPEDADVLLAHYGNSQTWYLDDAVPYPLHLERLRDHLAKRFDGDDGDDVRLAITTLEGRIIGTIAAYDSSMRHGVASVGLSITDAGERRKGYGADALCVLVRHLFHERRYHKVQADVHAFNVGSLALLRHLGFQEEGRLREVHFTGGRYCDSILFGMTAEEFDTAHPEYRLEWGATEP